MLDHLLYFEIVDIQLVLSRFNGNVFFENSRNIHIHPVLKTFIHLTSPNSNGMDLTYKDRFIYT